MLQTIFLMPFYPPDASVPAGLQTSEFLLRPLRATDVALDYDAVMSSKELLRQWSQGVWPSDTFTLADNLQDLQRHEAEHVERKAFTFTIMDLCETECLGCVYIQPLHPALEDTQVCASQWTDGTTYAADIGFWVRQSQLDDNLDGHLLSALISWFRGEWSFECVVFHANEYNVRQRKLFEAAKLNVSHVVTTKGVQWFVYD